MFQAWSATLPVFQLSVWPFGCFNQLKFGLLGGKDAAHSWFISVETEAKKQAENLPRAERCRCISQMCRLETDVQKKERIFSVLLFILQCYMGFLLLLSLASFIPLCQPLLSHTQTKTTTALRQPTPLIRGKWTGCLCLPKCLQKAFHGARRAVIRQAERGRRKKKTGTNLLRVSRFRKLPFRRGSTFFSSGDPSPACTCLFACGVYTLIKNQVSDT